MIQLGVILGHSASQLSIHLQFTEKNNRCGTYSAYYIFEMYVNACGCVTATELSSRSLGWSLLMVQWDTQWRMLSTWPSFPPYQRQSIPPVHHSPGLFDDMSPLNHDYFPLVNSEAAFQASILSGSSPAYPWRSVPTLNSFTELNFALVMF